MAARILSTTALLVALLAAHGPPPAAAARLLVPPPPAASFQPSAAAPEQQPPPRRPPAPADMDSLLISVAAAQPHGSPAGTEAAAPSRAAAGLAGSSSAMLLNEAAPTPAPLAGGGAAAAPAAAVPPGCGGVRSQIAFTVSAATRRKPRVLTGTVIVFNDRPYVRAIERVGLRLCSRDSCHQRAEAACASYDVPPRGSIACGWSIALPAAPLAGAALEDYTGLVCGVLVTTGERCVSDTLDPLTGRPGGTCSAGDK